jgi:hypothetical protein
VEDHKDSPLETLINHSLEDIERITGMVLDQFEYQLKNDAMHLVTERDRYLQEVAMKAETTVDDVLARFEEMRTQIEEVVLENNREMWQEWWEEDPGHRDIEASIRDELEYYLDELGLEGPWRGMTHAELVRLIDTVGRSQKWLTQGEPRTLKEVINRINPLLGPGIAKKLDLPRSSTTGSLWNKEERLTNILKNVGHLGAGNERERNKSIEGDLGNVSEWLSYIVDKSRDMWRPTRDDTSDGVLDNLILRSEDLDVSAAQSGRGIREIIPVLRDALEEKGSGRSNFRDRDYERNPEPILWVEEPEVHLHPKSQARLADLFVYAALAEEPRDYDRKQVIIETHSEHMLHRILRRIRETTNDTFDEDKQEGVSLPSWTNVRPEDVCILCVEPAENHKETSASIIRRLDIGPQGQLLDPFPEGFFQSEWEDRMSGHPESE